MNGIIFVIKMTVANRSTRESTIYNSLRQRRKEKKKIDNEKQTGGQKFQGKYRKKRIWAKKGRMEASDG